MSDHSILDEVVLCCGCHKPLRRLLAGRLRFHGLNCLDVYCTSLLADDLEKSRLDGVTRDDLHVRRFRRRAMLLIIDGGVEDSRIHPTRHQAEILKALRGGWEYPDEWNAPEPRIADSGHGVEDAYREATGDDDPLSFDAYLAVSG